MGCGAVLAADDVFAFATWAIVIFFLICVGLYLGLSMYRRRQKSDNYIRNGDYAAALQACLDADYNSTFYSDFKKETILLSIANIYNLLGEYELSKQYFDRLQIKKLAKIKYFCSALMYYEQNLRAETHDAIGKYFGTPNGVRNKRYQYELFGQILTVLRDDEKDEDQTKKTLSVFALKLESPLLQAIVKKIAD